MKPRRVNITRDLLARFIPDPRTIREFEDMAWNTATLADIVTALQAVPLIAMDFSEVLDDDRRLANGADVVFIDGGGKGDLSFGLTDTGVTPGPYGDASKVVSFTVDVKGRLSEAAEYELNSDNMTEGSANLFFTVARARSSVEGSSTVSYDVSTGVFSLTAGNVEAALGYTPYDAANPDSFVDEAGARSALSGGVGIAYNAGTGEIALDAIPAPDGTYANPTSITIVNGIITAIS